MWVPAGADRPVPFAPRGADNLPFSVVEEVSLVYILVLQNDINL